MKAAAKNIKPQEFVGRYYLVIGAIALVFAVLIGRTLYLLLAQGEFLQNQGNARSVRTEDIIAHRGTITDRNGDELAVSIPVDSVWADPHAMTKNVEAYQAFRSSDYWKMFAQVLDIPVAELNAKIDQNRDKRFVYLKRRVPTSLAEYVRKLGIPGVYLKTESQRYYPAGESVAHIVGFTNIDDQGQEGMERAFNDALTATDGKRQVVKDRRGQVIDQEGVINEMQPGQDIRLSIDQRMQFVAYRELKAAVLKNGAVSGSLVLLDIKTGEVLAMANAPSYNPNNPLDREGFRFRNRSMTDPVEPGSTMKPLLMLAALESGKFSEHTLIDTYPGIYRVGGKTVRDTHSYGTLDLAGIIMKSSNVGVSKVALQLEPAKIVDLFARLGFGTDTGSGFPGENSGFLKMKRKWSEFEIAVMSFGYGITVTPLQLARAYAIVGSGGIKYPVSMLKLDKAAIGERVVDAKTAQAVLSMMETVLSDKGTGKKARIKGYRVAGKTGTARKAENGSYGNDYVGFFAGLAPVSNPRVACVVLINEPKGDEYYGGDVAAPVFSAVVGSALRILNVEPDNAVDTTLLTTAMGAR